MAQGISIPVVQSGLEASIQQGVKNVGQINIQATVDPSAFKNLAQPLGRVSGLATEFEKSIAASNARVLAFGASVGIINGVQNAFASLVTTGIEVQKTLADIAAISGRSGQELSKFGDSLFEIGKTTGQTFKTASEAALEFSRQGLSVEETLKRTNDALTLTRFTTLSAAEAVDVLTAAANSFSETGITTAQIINKLVAVDTKFAVSAEDLAKGLARAGSIAQEVGVNFDQLNAAVTVAQERTARGGAVIGNALKTIFTRLRSNETVQALRDIGVESLDSQGKLKGAIPLLEELSKKLQGLSGGERVQILEAVASKYNINILSALLADLGTANSKFGQAVAISAGAGNQAYERQIELNKTLAAQINNTTVSVTQLFNKLAEIGVTESLSNLLSFVNDLLSGFNKLLDSGSVGGDIAKGLIKGISDVFFTIGLPVLAAIFVKLTTDIAKFGVESLKTILGINQQVRERQALEQAVVNTLIRDQEVMASILALSGNRAKQEEYLLGVYNRQISALQQVQNIASSVAPALMTGGLSATSGQVKKRGAGGYLPAQEAADVRRGVGGASASSKVVSIPNFAFGGGKRGTMVANTSEYIVPNFANGGSAIFNQDMARAYGLPAGAKKISAAGGYIPNFAAMGDYAALVGEKSLGEKGFLQNTVKYVREGEGKQLEVSQTAAQGGKPIAFDIYGVPSQSVSQIAKAKEALSDTGKNLAVNIARSMTRDLPSDLVQSKLAATFNPGSLQSFANTVFEASIGSLLGDKRFDDYAEQTTTSAFDLDISNNPDIKKSLGIEGAVKFLEVKGNKTQKLMDSVAKKIYQVTEGQRAATEKRKIGAEEAKKMGVGRPLITKNGNNYSVDGQVFNSQEKVENYLTEKYTQGWGITQNPSAKQFGLQWRGISRGSRAAFGYIPNFAQDPLKDAIQREMNAGLSPSQIRVTRDGRLRNSDNPNGFAVINTRDEPNGKIPNFADVSRKNIKKLLGRSPNPIDASLYSGGQNFDYGVGSGSVAPTSIPTKAQVSDEASVKKANEELAKSTQGASLGILKMSAVFGALSSASYMLEASIKQTDSSVLKFTKGLVDVGQKASLGLTIGEGFKPILEMGSKLPGVMGVFTKSLASASPVIGAVVGGLFGLVDILEYITSEDKRKGSKTAGDFIGAISGLSTEKQIKALEEKAGQEALKISQGQASKEGYLKRVSARSNAFQMGGMGGGVGFAGAVTSQTEEEKKAEEQMQSAQGASEEYNKRLTELKKQQTQETIRQNGEAQDQLKLERERLTLVGQINEINLTFSQNENKNLIDRLKNRIKLNQSIILGTQAQKDDVALQIKLNDLSNEKEDVNTKAIQSTLNQLKNLSSLGTVDKAALNTLIEKIKQSKKLESLEIEIAALKGEGLLKAKGIIDTEVAGKKQAEGKVEARIEEAKLVNDSERSSKATLDREKLINDSILQRINFLDQERNIRSEFSTESASLKRQLPLKQLEAQISGKAFATPEEDLRRLQLQRISKIEEEKANITTAANKRNEAAYIDLKKSILDTVPALEFLGKKETDNITNRIAQINAIEDQTKRFEELQRFATEFGKKQYIVDFANPLNMEELKKNVQALSNAQSGVTNVLTIQNKIIENGTALDKERLKLAIETKNYEEKIAEIRAKSKPMAGFARAFGDIEKESANFSETFTYNTTNAFRDGLRDAMGAAISQTDDLGAALQNVATNFLKSMQTAFLNQAAGNITSAIGRGLGAPTPTPPVGLAKGGVVTGGGGYRDDVPAMLTSGEFVMRKSAVQKYGTSNLERMNNGGMFIPGTRGGGAISGDDALRAFANQTTTSGATDVLSGSRSSAFINLEDQSQKLSRYALLGDDTISQEVRSAQGQAFDILKNKSDFEKQQKEMEKQQKKALTRQLISTVASAALSYGAGKAFGQAPTKGLSKLPVSYGASANPASYGPMAFGLSSQMFPNGKGMFRAYGGAVRRYASGGPTDDIPAMLMSGEYVMNRGASRKYGKQFLDSMNQGRAPRFADGGEASPSATTTTTESNAKTMGDVNISINVTGQTSQTETQGNSSQGGIDYKKMSEKIKMVVMETLNEEKRLGGSLRTR